MSTQAWQKFEGGSSTAFSEFLGALTPGKPVRIILSQGWGPEVAELFRALPDNIDLRYLAIQGNQVGEEALLKLFNLPQLHLTRCICLERCGLTDVGVCALVENPAIQSLVELHLCNRGGLTTGLRNEISDQGAIALAKSQYLGKLESLDLWNTELGDTGFRTLVNAQKLSSLRRLCVWGTQLTAEGFAQVKRELSSTRPLSLQTDFNRPTIWEW